MDDVFRALADPTRRSLLDELFKEDGQTLTALEGRLPMSRFGVMKHLKVLEEANLVVTKRRGREKLHFLNPVPIRLVHDRWVSKYAEPWAATLTGLKRNLEDRTMEKVFEIYIKTTPEQLWEAITDPKMRAKYSFGVETNSEWTNGSGYTAGVPGVIDIAEGENLEVDPPHRLVQSFNALWSDEVKAEGTSRVTWDIEQVEDSCRLTVTHDELREGAHGEIYGGWPMILSGLKTLLETGEQLTTPGSLLYSGAARRLDRQLHAPRARLAGEPLVDLPRARLELHPLRVPARSEVLLVGGVRVERGERVRRMSESGRLERRDEAEPRPGARRAARCRAGEEQPAAAREPERAQHVRRPFHSGHDQAAGIRVRVEQEPERDLVEALGRGGPGSPVRSTGHRWRHPRVSIAHRSVSRRAFP